MCRVHRFSLQRATGLALQHERTHFGGAATYGYFAAVRSDTAVYTPLTPALPLLATSPHAIALPNFQHWGGLNDRFAVGGRAVMLGVYLRQLEIARRGLEGGRGGGQAWTRGRENTGVCSTCALPLCVP